MNNPVKRLIHTIIITIVFLFIYAQVMYIVERRSYVDLIAMHNDSQTESMRSILDQYAEAEKEIRDIYGNDLSTMVRLKTLALMDSITNGEYQGTRMWENEAVVRVRNGSLDVPKEAAGLFPELSADMVRNEYAPTRSVMETGEGEPEDAFLTSGKIADEWYLIHWIPTRYYDEYVSSYVDRYRQMENLSEHYDGEMILAVADGNDGGLEAGTIVFGTEIAKDCATISELGITGSDLSKDYFTLRMKKDSYICTPVELQSGEILICCDSIKEERLAFLGDVLTQILFAAALFAVLVVWCYSVLALVNGEEMTEDLIVRYSPAAVKTKTAKLLGASVLLVFVVAYLTVVMQHTYQEDKAGNAAMNLLEEQIEGEVLTNANRQAYNNNRYVAFGQEIAGILAEDPGFLEKSRLSELARMIAADYLIVFDEDGNEIGCSEDYTGFSLGTGEKEPSADFRRLLKGVPSAVHESEEDFITRQERRTIGVRYDRGDAQGRYGAVLVSLPTATGGDLTEKADRKQWIYKALASKGKMILEIDPESQVIKSGSWENYVGGAAAALGIVKESLMDRYINFFRIDRDWYFGVSRMIGGSLYYYFTEITVVLKIGFMFALLTAAIFMLGYWITARYALYDYTKANYETYTTGIREVKQKNRERLDEIAPFVSSYVKKWDVMLPEQRVKHVMRIGIGLFMAALLLLAVSETPLANHSALNFIIEGKWTKGFNLFGVVATIMVFSVEYLLYLIIKIVFLFLYGILDSKGETIGQLVRSLINYLLIAGAICLSLSFFGVDTPTLLASIGILSLAISLGAKDIVADILSGISLVFDGTYGVGDYVEVNGFRGKVTEIGIRSTKILGDANDIKTINNSSVNNVLNLSKKTSFCTVTFAVRASESLDRIEEMLLRELPAYKDKIPGIISGPAFTGVKSVNEGKMTLEIIAEAREADIPSVQLGLNRMLQSLYERKLLKSHMVTTNIAVKFAEDESGIVRIRDVPDEEEAPQEAEQPGTEGR